MIFPINWLQPPDRNTGNCLSALNITLVLLSDADTKLGGVETFAGANAFKLMFKQHTDAIDGILVVLPISAMKGLAETIKWSGLNVPVLIQALSR